MEPQNQSDVFTLIDDTGAAADYEILDVLEWGGEEFAVLFPLAQTDTPGAVILRIVPADADEPETYEGVDEATMNAVFSLFRQRHKEELS